MAHPTVPVRGSDARAAGLRSWLELLRPANIATAPADVLAGAAVAGALVPPTPALIWLIPATMALYGGGIVLNDVFDSHLDARERPERPIPSGRVPVASARLLGFGLLAAGVLAASMAGSTAAGVAAAIAVAVLTYDAAAKHHAVAGPAVMGLCRGLNLLLGAAAVSGGPGAAWPIALLPFTYITGVTVVSRGEVHGSQRPVVGAGFLLIAVVLLALFVIAAFDGRSRSLSAADRVIVLAVLGWLAARVIPPFATLLARPAPALIGRAVRTGVLSLVLVETVIAGAYAGIMAVPAVLATGLIAWLLARLFAVT